MSKKNTSTYGFLLEKPKIPGVTGFTHLDMFEKMAGKSDAKKNQICAYEDGHTGPRINTKAGFLDSYEDKMYLKTAVALEPLVKEVHMLVTELQMIQMPSAVPEGLHPEEASRRMRAAAGKASAAEARKEEIMILLSKNEAELNMMDEALTHHIESAEGIFEAKIAKYWSGALQKAKEPLEYKPIVVRKLYPGREKYEANRDRVLALLVETLGNANDGGESNVA